MSNNRSQSIDTSPQKPGGMKELFNIDRMQELRTFLLKHRASDDEHTHASQIDPVGKFNVSTTVAGGETMSGATTTGGSGGEGSEIETFFSLYCDTIRNGVTSATGGIGILENAGEVFPVVIDVDIKVELETNLNSIKKKPYDRSNGDDYRMKKKVAFPYTAKLLYSKEQVDAVIEVCQTQIKLILNDVQPRHLLCFILERTKSFVDNQGYIRSGFHIHFPKCWISRVNQKVHLIPRIQAEVNRKNMFNTLVEKSATFIESVFSKNWMMYGGKRDPQGEAFKVTRTVDEDLKDIKMIVGLRDYKLFNFSGEVIPLKNLEEIEYNLPRILSIIRSPNIQVLEIKPKLTCELKTTFPKAKDSTRIQENNLTTLQALTIAKELLDFISGERLVHQYKWFDLGKALFTLSDGSREGLSLWNRFVSLSKKNPTYHSETLSVYEWDRMCRTNFSLSTLQFWAQEDNPREYKKYKDDKAIKAANNCLYGSHYDIARMMYDFYGHQFVYVGTDSKKPLWYHFKNHRWHRTEDGLDLKKYISDSNGILGHFLAIRKSIVEEIRKREDDDFEELSGGGAGERSEGEFSDSDEPKEEEVERSETKRDRDDDSKDSLKGTLAKKQKLVEKTIVNLKNSSFKKCIMKEAEEVFFKKDFQEQLDSNPFLVGFNNGIFDLSFHSFGFREGKAEDMITHSVRYDYKEVEEESQEMAQLVDFLSKVFPDLELLKYFMRYAATILESGNSAKLFPVWTGGGDNGKSMVVMLLEETLGEYAIKFPTALATGKRTQSSQAAPELARSASKKFAVMQEPSETEKLNDGLIKELTGGDSFYVRGLYKGGGEIKPMFKVVEICNKKPRFNTDDPALWNRVRVLPFEAKFVDESKCAPTFQEQLREKKFAMDRFLSGKLKYMKEAFMYRLIRTYRETRGKFYPDPEKVKVATLDYKTSNDFYAQFITERIVEDKEGKIGVTEFFTLFKAWFRDSYPKMDFSLSKWDTRDNITKRWGVPVNEVWLGHRERDIDLDIKEGKATLIPLIGNKGKKDDLADMN